MESWRLKPRNIIVINPTHFDAKGATVAKAIPEMNQIWYHYDNCGKSRCGLGKLNVLRSPKMMKKRIEFAKVNVQTEVTLIYEEGSD